MTRLTAKRRLALNNRPAGPVMFSRSAEYAIRAMTFLAAQPPGKLSGAREISQAENIPMPFLWKILNNLTRLKMIRSFKGVRGGYELARRAQEITVSDIIQATDNIHVVQNCVLGLAECNEANPCPLHPLWKEIKTKLADMLEENTLADMAVVVQRRELARKLDRSQ